MPGTIYDRGAGVKSSALHKAGQPQSAKGETAEGKVSAQDTVSGTMQKMQRTVTESGALSSLVDKSDDTDKTMNAFPLREYRSWFFFCTAGRKRQKERGNLL